MPDQTIQVQISPIGGGSGGGGGNADSISAEDYLTYDSANLVVGVQDGSLTGDVAVWDGSQWVIERLDALDVDYPNNANLDTVEDAILQALFEAGEFDYVRVEGGDKRVIQVGREINTSFDLSWDLTVDQADLDSLSAGSIDVDGDFNAIDKNSSSPVSISLNSPITDTEPAKDDVNMSYLITSPLGNTYEAEGDASFEHQARFFFGVDDADTPTETILESLTSELKLYRPKDRVLSFDPSVSPGQNYVYLAWPQTMGEPDRLLINGIETTFKGFSVDVTNSFGVTQIYYAYRTLNKTAAPELEIEIV